MNRIEPVFVFQPHVGIKLEAGSAIAGDKHKVSGKCLTGNQCVLKRQRSAKSARVIVKLGGNFGVFFGKRFDL